MSTPLPIIANVSRIVTKVVDRVTGDRADVPLMVASATVEALKNHGVPAQIFYGPAAWVEILENQQAIWAGCWGENFHFWAATASGEIIDLNTSVAHRKRGHSQPELRAVYSPPILWSSEVPAFYRYIPEGIAEIELTEEKDQRQFQLVLDEIAAKCRPELLKGEFEEFPNEPILCPGRKILDDSAGTFKLFDRALGVHGVPKPVPI
ncbi:hypothetical protein EBZ37_01125 [bacterium]|nr:hypothetical protein [bacterium]